MKTAFRLATIAVVFFAGAAIAQQATTSSGSPLIQLLQSKGVISAEEAAQINQGPPAEIEQRLTRLLQQKGVISASEAEELQPSPAAMTVADSSSSHARLHPALLVTTEAAQAATPPATPKPPAFNAAIAPVRVLQLEPTKPSGLIPDIKLGSGAKIKFYGFLKASAVYDTSSQQGNDFPLPQFLGDTGPSGSPEFHIKARSSRFGANFDWPDISSGLSLTGRIEFDFEGNFSRANNRNISTIRSNMPQLRLAWARVDYAVTPATSVFALFGQDWTPFASSTLPNLIEVTGLGISYGTLYERAPQIRGGFLHDFGGERHFKIGPEIAAVLPAYGNLPPFIGPITATIPNPLPAPTVPPTPLNVTLVIPPGNLGDQLGFGERQGVDSARPEVQGRLVAQWQLDTAKGVAPAQFIISGMEGSRRAILTTAAIPTCTNTSALICPGGVDTFKAAFPHGVEVDSDRWGGTAEIQLPTRFMTLVGKFYRGSDLRFYFAGELFSEFSEMGGLKGTAGPAQTGCPAKFNCGFSIDGSSTVVFGLNAAGAPAVAPQRPVRTQGGFVQLGFPLSRIFNADPAGHNAGWSFFLHYGLDDAYARDVRRFGVNNRDKSDMAAATLNYKLNSFVTFGYEASVYRTRALNHLAAATVLFEGVPRSQVHDFRSEYATIFTF